MDEAFIIRTLATWFGCGRAPKGPGTFGTLGAIPLFVFFAYFLQPIPYMIATFAFIVASILVAHAHEAVFAQHDASEVVIDEVAGYLVTMTWVPLGWKYVVAGFVLFRFFDILKPFPISYIDRKVKGGVGCVADDLLAGILSNIILQFLLQKGWL